MEDWIKKWYNDQFNKIDLSPSSEVWDNISVSMEDWPKHWYKSNTNEIKTDPRPSTWQSINSQLADINYPARHTRPAYILIAIVILILSLIPNSLSDGYIDSSNGQDFVLAKNHKTDSSLEEYLLNSSNPIEKHTKNSDNQTTKSIASISEEVEKNDQSENIELVDETSSNEIAPSLNSPDLPLIKQEEINKMIVDNVLIEDDHDLVSLQPTIINYPEIDLNADLVYRAKDISKPNYSIGLHFVPQFSSLLNPLRTKIRANADIEALNPVSVGFDMSFEKYITSKNSLRVSVRGNNIKSLKFREQNTLKEMTLNYASLDLTYSRNWRLGNSEKLYLKTYIGIFAGYAISKGVNYNGDRVAYIEDGLQNMDFGNSMGLILSRKIANNTRLEIGANSQFGAMNIFKGTDVLPSKYFRTSTISYGLSIGVVREF